MRLTQKELEIIKTETKKIFGPSILYLFGSRVDDNKKGGDIDLYIIPKERQNLLSKRARLRFILENRLFKPVDIVVANDSKRLIEQEALKGVQL